MAEEDDDLKHLDTRDLASAARAKNAWRALMLGERPHPGEFEQHILPVDAIERLSRPSPLSPFLNRYFLRTAHVDVLASESHCFVYAKLCKIIVVGFIRVEKPRRWKGTKVHVSGGGIGATNYEVPQILLRYWNGKADEAAGALAEMSPRQKGKVDEVFRSTPARMLAESESFRAMRADVAFSGEAAFRITGRQPSGDDS